MRKLPKNIILVSIDDLRFDCIGVEKDRRYLNQYGLSDLIDTPNIDYFAIHGVRFTHAFTTAPYTSSSHASAFTGLYPPRHGCRSFLYTGISQSSITLAQILKSKGYNTFHCYDGKDVFEILGLNKGADFCIWRDNRKLINLLKSHDKEKNYVFVHFFDIHEPYGFSPYEVSPDYNMNIVSDYQRLYRGLITKDKNLELPEKVTGALLEEIQHMAYRRGDAELRKEVIMQYIKGVIKFDKGRFRWLFKNLKEAGIIDDAFIIIFSDHGEKDYGDYFGHGGSLSEELIRVPLIFYGPGIIGEGKIVEEPVSLVDILPTLLDILNLPSPKNLDGESLLPYMLGDERGSERKIYVENWNYDLRTLREKAKKYFKNGNFSSAECEHCLYQRCLRTQEYKYILMGENLNPSGKLTDTNFIRWCYRNLLFRLEKEEEIQYWRKEMKNLNREKLINIFLKNQRKRKHLLFNIKKDPFERINLLCNEGKKYLPLAESMLEELETFSESSKGLPGREIEIENEVELKKRLEALGYI